MTEVSQEPATKPAVEANITQNALGALNAKTRARQRMLLLGGGGTVTALVLWAVFGTGMSGPPKVDGVQKIETDGLVNRDLSQREFVSMYANRLDAQQRQIKALEDTRGDPKALQTQLDTLAAQNTAMKADGQHAIDALTNENKALRQSAEAQAAANVPPPPLPPRSIAARGNTAGTSGPDAPDPLPQREVKTLSFTAAATDAHAAHSSRPAAGTLEVEDSPDYLPPNSYAPARVIVGVDASAGVASQTDPLPVVLRITGPARSVVKDGKVLSTRLEGCVVNGAARGDLSAEKVYVKLAKMTCDQPGGRVAVSEVKGFISFAGKTGVRGRVVSREGNLISQALLAGVVGGFGRGFSANANSVFQGLTSGASGKRSPLSGGDIAQGGLGQGIGEAADTVSKYLIERAEQYQPVIEMPTGIDVEIVFLDGVYVRKSQ